MNPLNVEHRPDGSAIVKLIGRLDAETCGDLEAELDALLAKAPRLIAFDLQQVEYISSAGVRLILKARNHMGRLKRRVVAANATPQVKRVFDAVKNLAVDELFDNQADLDAYLDMLQRPEAPLNSDPYAT